ncbi:PilZ domain-containing protein [Shewanella sp. SR43-4]|jgi:type IV pilus assembly protein PilZ|uniref:PilZ domain-containing protein n=1 Tax=Shewanella vesiculosa TaxID=518738 RepID=A0ABV0FQC1_9GAMM|nr:MULTISPECIES: PilZ domain-containing protein [Shewanella]NCQ43685.1 pilus assembly protein PilZ [Shewanella frigidimarina]MBB1316896.1 PilZ domain-containing protein [Shewanella sp. SR43-4]MBB1321774.1 PilZ domain-containing protein [Shewanella sp. SR43-8]MBB1388476.1 PilZ domain-containing protein [Shewanella sp. SG44-6]MBB1476661.1 PilZ domain-containing protein [Shewanella sp. SG41-3]|tara:strand:+ start:7715 stop:8041 length:327 start_codon:yes stop_codon:yes gene_type:complete
MVDLVVHYDTLHKLYRAYMPFIKPAGLFIATTESHFLGQELTIAYRLPDATQATEFKGTVVWINPLGASGGRPAGIGVKIKTDVESHKHHIEKLLSSELSSSDLTCTM